jgi:hypothetical protein
VALPPAELPREVFPFFPRGWITRVNNVIDPVELQLMAQITDQRRQGLRLAQLASRVPVAWSPTANLVWWRMDRKAAATRIRLSVELEERVASRQDGFSYLQVGPRFPALDDEAYANALVNGWATASLQMHRLCGANGIIYLHFLQPNQYVPDAKPMSAEERRAGFDPDHPYRRGVELGYPGLARQGERLAGEGLAFRDLRFMFSDLREPVFIDTCCHVSAAGYAMVAEEVAGEILARLPGKS